MKIPLSKRLEAACKFVKPGDRVADIGCDHGYLGIYLLKNNIASQVIASDINEGPLNAAVFNAEKFGVRDKMRFYLSDGVKNIPRDFDAMVCCGIGGDTMISILEAALWLKTTYLVVVAGTVLWGILTLALQNAHAKLWLRQKTAVSLLLSSCSILLFIISRQPYAAVLTFVFLLIKGFILIKQP